VGLQISCKERVHLCLKDKARCNDTHWLFAVDAVSQLQVLLLHCLLGCSDCSSLQPSPSNCGQLHQPMLQQLVVSFRKIYLKHSITCRLLQPDLTVLSLATHIVNIGLSTIFIITLSLLVNGSVTSGLWCCNLPLSGDWFCI